MLHDILLLAAFLLPAQSPWPSPEAANGSGMRIEVRPSTGNYEYALGDTARFEVTVAGNGALRLAYEFSHCGAETYERGERELRTGVLTLSGVMNEPGFLRLDLTLRAGDDSLRAAEAVGYAPEAIVPSAVLPDDYRRFWGAGLAELLRVPMDPRVEHRPEFDRDGMRRYLVSLANIEGSRIYGWLTVPAGDGPFPAVVHIPGAPGGVNEYHTGANEAYAEDGLLVLSLNIHGVPIDLPQATYEDYHRRGQLGYPALNGVDDKYRYYYRRVVLGAVRAMDYLHSRDDVDTGRVAVAGGSQGGGLALLTTSIDTRADALLLHVPAMLDHFGPLRGRPAGWPFLLRRADGPDVRHTAGYFDGALAASQIDVPTVAGLSLLDESSPPTTVYAMFNSLRGPKKLFVHPGVHHPGSFSPGRYRELRQWLVELFADE